MPYFKEEKGMTVLIMVQYYCCFCDSFILIECIFVLMLMHILIPFLRYIRCFFGKIKSV